MKFKLAVPRNVLTAYQIGLIEEVLAEKLLDTVVRSFPNWKERADAQEISGGEIILQDTDMTRPIKGLSPGIHVTISLITYMVGRDFDRLAHDTISLIKKTKDENDQLFMSKVKICVQMCLDRTVVRAGTTSNFTTSGDGTSLLDYLG
jgi:hypothetical protein